MIHLKSISVRKWNEKDSQFIIAAHSPIILAFPEADIISFENDMMKQVQYEELEHVKLTKKFSK